MKSILLRLEELEKGKEPLIIIAEVNGKEIEMTAQEFKKTKGAGLIKILGGANVRDVDIILDYIDKISKI